MDGGWLLWKARRAEAGYARSLWQVLYVLHRLVDIVEETNQFVANLDVEYGLVGQTVRGQPAESPFATAVENGQREVCDYRELIKKTADLMATSTANALTLNAAVSAPVLAQTVDEAKKRKKAARALRTQLADKLKQYEARLDELRAVQTTKEEIFERSLARQDHSRQ